MWQSYLHHQADVVVPFLKGVRCMLDFGCGDMRLDRVLAERFPRLSVTGVDVLDGPLLKGKRLTYVRYGGRALPFANNSFDCVLCYHVFHHTTDPAFHLSECVRAARKWIVVVEPVLRFGLDWYGFALLDILTNDWKKERIAMPFSIAAIDWWDRQFRKQRVQLVHTGDAGVLPTFFPIGATKLFVLEKFG